MIEMTYEEFMEGRTVRIPSFEPRKPSYTCSKAVWNEYVNAGKVTPVSEQLKRVDPKMQPAFFRKLQRRYEKGWL